MSNKKRRNKDKSAAVIGLGLNDSGSDSSTFNEANNTNQSIAPGGGLFAYLKGHLWVTALIALVTLGAMGAGLKYMEESAKREAAAGLSQNRDRSWLSKLNPFAAPEPLPLPSPPLSKEYIYAGSRTLAIEDKAANAIPPADLAVWREADGSWHVLGGPGSQQTFASWGQNQDIAIPGDYDGDGKTDFSIYRPGNGAWAIYYSSDSTSISFPFGGGADDKPAVADYDGDGKTDAAIFRPGTPNTFYIRKSSDGTIISQQFGQIDDRPVPADYDGDGKADICIYRPGNSTYSVLKSSNSQIQTQTFGQNTDEQVPADYDGDGKADFAVRRVTMWYILRSSDNQVDSYSWGDWNYDTAVPNDYDGDGKVDVAVWRKADSSAGAHDTGFWYIRNSSTGLIRSVLWGAAGDKPVPAYYRR